MYEFRILRSFKTIPEITEVIGEPARMVKQEESQVLQFRPRGKDLNWEDVPVVDFDLDTGEYI